jgi:hypothetical protein
MAVWAYFMPHRRIRLFRPNRHHRVAPLRSGRSETSAPVAIFATVDWGGLTLMDTSRIGTLVPAADLLPLFSVPSFFQRGGLAVQRLGKFQE